MKNAAIKESIIDILHPENDFINEVEMMVKAGNGYVDSILEWCSRKGIEIDQIISLIKKDNQFRNKLTKEATELHFLKRKKTRRKKYG